MNKKIIIIPIVLILGVLVIYIITSKMPYESRYFERLGINRSRYLYRDMLKDFGEPKKTAPHGYKSIIAIYDDFEMSFYSTDDDAQLQTIIITGRKYRFGRQSIGIGSTKEAVIKAYPELMSYQDPHYYTCLDGNILVEFYFDKNNIVNKIEFYDYSLGP